MSAWRDGVCRLFRVPPDPEPPPGNPPQTFRAAPNFYYLKLIERVLGQFFLLLFCIGASVGAGAAWYAGAPGVARWVLAVIATLLWMLLLIELVIGYVVVRLEFDLRWYMVSDRAIRIREGILTVKEKTIALANIQNISIKQGPLQRLLGIADVEVRTAGGSEPATGGGQSAGVGEPLHVAYFRGVDNADAIRDLLRDAARRYADSGLGDPDDVAEITRDDGEAAAQLLLDECRQVRAVLEAART